MSTHISPENQDILEKLSEENRKELIRSCIHAIIVLGQNKTPIKRQELNKLVFPTSNYRISGAVLQAANRELNSIFGMRLYETADKLKYLLVNKSTDYAAYQKHSENSESELTVLYFVLVGIFSSADEKLSEDEILKSLKPLEISVTTLKNYIDSFVKKLYLTSERIEESKFYRWGSRAMAEVNPVEFFNRFLELSGSSSSKEWPDLIVRVEKLKALHERT